MALATCATYSRPPASLRNTRRCELLTETIHSACGASH